MAQGFNLAASLILQIKRLTRQIRTHMNVIKHLASTAILILTFFGSFYGYTKPLSTQNAPSELFALLPSNCPTPDAFDIAPNGSLTLSCTNFADKSLEGELFSIDEIGQVTHLATVPRLNEKRKANPMGIAYGSDGGLYVADARGPNKGRILKLSFIDNVLVKTEVIATGLNPNGLRYYKGALYATQLTMPKIESDQNVSGIYRFNENDRDLMLSNTLADEQLIFHVKTQNPKKQLGLDGLAFDSEGHLYTADLGDGIVYKLTLNLAGKITANEVYANVPWQSSVDGMTFDSEDNMYLAGFASNQVLKIDVSGLVSIIVEFDDNDGTNGQLDQPADLIIFENKLIVSNFDLMTAEGFKNSGHNKPYTLTSIDIGLAKPK